MVDSMSIYKSLTIDIGIVMRNPKMLKFVPDHIFVKRASNVFCLNRK